MIDHVLNSKQAKKVFEANSVYIDGMDIITVKRARELFSKDAVDFAERTAAHNKVNSFGVVGFTYLGFVDICTVHNADLVKKGKDIHK